MPIALLQEKSQTQKEPKLHFYFYAPEAKEVFVAGSFNQWNPESCRLDVDDHGYWRGETEATPGHHEYRFVVDGVWLEDPLAERLVRNPYGSFNCVRVVSS